MTGHRDRGGRTSWSRGALQASPAPERLGPAFIHVRPRHFIHVVEDDRRSSTHLELRRFQLIVPDVNHQLRIDPPAGCCFVEMTWQHTHRVDRACRLPPCAARVREVRAFFRAETMPPRGSAFEARFANGLSDVDDVLVVESVSADLLRLAMLRVVTPRFELSG